MMVLDNVGFEEVQFAVAIGVFTTKPAGEITIEEIEGAKGFPTCLSALAA
jgi:hypothetical protein